MPERTPTARDRIVVVESVYHQLADSQPTVVESRWSRRITSDEQPYQRRIKLGPDWQPLDTGWLGENVGTVLIAVDQSATTSLPSAELGDEKSIAAVEVSLYWTPPIPFDTAVAGESIRINAPPPGKILLHCRDGEARVTITVFPK